MNQGRPNEGLVKKISIKVDEETYSKVAYLSNKSGKSVSEYLRDIIKRNVR